jgi:hypothetical protein
MLNQAPLRVLFSYKQAGDGVKHPIRSNLPSDRKKGGVFHGRHFHAGRIG